MTAAGRLQAGAKTFPFLKVAIVVFGAAYLYIAAATISQAQGDLGAIGWPKVVGFALAPICVFAALRYPVVFPFGLYIVLAPFDSLLEVAGTAALLRIVGFAVIGTLLLRMLRLRKFCLPQQSWYVWLAYVGYAALTMFWTADFDNGLKTLITISLLFVMMTVLATYPVTEREFQIILGFVVIGSIGAGIVCMKQFFGGAVTPEDAPRLDLSQNGFSVDVNYLGGSFIAPSAIALAGVFYGKNPLLRIICAISVFIFLIGIFSNASRESFLAVSVILAFYVVRSKHRLPALGFGALAASSIVFFPNIFNRLFQANIADGSGRTEIWSAGMHSFGDHWLLGAGIGSFQEVYDRNLLQVVMKSFTGWHRPGHSIVFVGLNDYGVLGSLLVVACWYVSFRQLAVIPRDSKFYPYRIACEAAVIGLSVQALFIDPFYIKYIWFTHSLALMAVNLYNPRSVGFGRTNVARAPAFYGEHAYRGG